MNRPKHVNNIILLWILSLACIIFFNLHYYMETFVWQTEGFINIAGNYLFLIQSNGFLIILIVIIFNTFDVRKWSWIANVCFSFFFLLYFGQIFLYCIRIIILPVPREYVSLPNFIGWAIANSLIPVFMLIIFILLFKPSVKEYFNQN